MAIGDSFRKLIGIEENDDEFTEEELEEARQAVLEAEEEEREVRKRPSYFAKPEPQPTPAQQMVRTMTGQQTVVVIEPKSFDECPKLVDGLKGRRPVILNLENVETETARKIFDFLSGAAYALNGTVKKIANNIFIFAPENISISQNEERSFDFGAQNSPWKR